jgi:UDP-glucose:(heptosyl)LPS alpha-1,3-glucosyltransferase
MKFCLLYHQMVAGGGLENYLLTFGRRLRERGHSLHLVCTRIDSQFEEIGSKLTRIELTGVPSALQLPEFSREAERLRSRGRLDVDFWLGFGRTVSQDIHRAGGGCHARYSDLLSWMKRVGPKNRAELNLERELYTSGKTRHFVVNSHQVGRELAAAYGVTDENISVIHTAVDVGHYRPVTDRKANAQPVILFASSHHRRKGLDTLLEAVRKIKNVQVWIVGQSPGLGWRWKVAQMGLSGRVKWLGWMPDMLAVYQAADIFVHPSRYDACANTVLQAMACGLPTIVSAADGAVEFVESGSNGLVLKDPTDAAELRHHLLTILSLTRGQRRALGHGAREATLPLSWGRHTEQWINLVEQLGSLRRNLSYETDDEAMAFAQTHHA